MGGSGATSERERFEEKRYDLIQSRRSPFAIEFEPVLEKDFDWIFFRLILNIYKGGMEVPDDRDFKR